MLEGEREVHLCVGDLFNETTDAIVNSIGRDMGMSRGLSAILFKKAGKKVREQCTKFKERNQLLPVGDCFSTIGGNLPVNFILHAAGPRGPTEGPLLAKTVLSCLRKAESLGCKSLALPLISTGALGFPVLECVRVTLETVSKFLLSSKSLRLVRILCRDQPTFNSVCHLIPV